VPDTPPISQVPLSLKLAFALSLLPPQFPTTSFLGSVEALPDDVDELSLLLQPQPVSIAPPTVSIKAENNMTANFLIETLPM
jgi:hypothetical protein